MLKEKIRLISIVLLYINMLFIVNYGYAYICDSTGIDGMYLLSIFFSWFPFVFSLVIIAGHALIMYNRIFEKAWKYVYLIGALLLLNLFFLLSMKQFMFWGQKILSFIVTMFFLAEGISELQVESIKRKNNYDRNRESEMIKKIKSKKEELFSGRKNRLQKCYKLSVFCIILDVSKWLYFLCALLLCVCIAKTILGDRYGCSDVNDIQSNKIKRIACYYSFILLSVLLYGEIRSVFVCCLFMLSKLYDAFLETKAFRKIYAKLETI